MAEFAAEFERDFSLVSRLFGTIAKKKEVIKYSIIMVLKSI